MHTNALVDEKSPYLKQHAHNPVDWLPWGEEAFEKARREDKPIFLSIGYSTCHWCHVMAHESFEDEATAEILNRYFVPIKLDREERPDVDRIYMLFVQATTGSGGWPMSVWLTPQLKPFFGGTYFPPGTKYGRPGFSDLLKHLARAWETDRTQIDEASLNVAEQLRSMGAPSKSGAPPDRELFGAAYWQFRRSFDSRLGGFGSAPKFPRPVTLNYLLRYYFVEKSDEALEMVVKTLSAMAAGGMHDHLGGGFHRYSVDEHWFVPHFEKMLYDQAQLAVSYLEAFQITGEARFADVARDIFAYVMRDLTDANGGFYSAEDADSPDPENPAHSGEGGFYIWRKSEIDRLLGAGNSAVFCDRYGVEKDGNVEQDPHGEFTGRNILYEAAPVVSPTAAIDLESSKAFLFQAREKRPRPHLDNKILTAWNGLMISALAKGYAVLNHSPYLEAARRSASFLLLTMYNAETGVLLRRFCDGEAAVSGFLDDYAFLAQALLDLFEVTGEAAYLKTALDLSRRGFNRFRDKEGGFFSTAPSQSDLLLRLKDDYDGAEPSGNSVATDVLIRLAHLVDDEQMASYAEGSLTSFAPKLKAQPTMAPQMLVALSRFLAKPEQTVIRSPADDPEARQLASDSRLPFAPFTTVLDLTDENALEIQPLAAFLGQLPRTGRITIYHCRDFTCELPKVID